MKFGGSSVQDAVAIGRVVALVREHLAARPVVVVSAIAGATRTLSQIADLAAQDPTAAEEQLNRLIHRHHGLAAGLGLGAEAMTMVSTTIESHGHEIQHLITSVAGHAAFGRIKDAILSFGERLSTLLVHAAAVADGVDAVRVNATEIIVTDARFGKARPLYEELGARVDRLVRPHVGAGCVPVIEGFIGATRDGTPTTMGFEASDVTASLVGAALGVREVQIWTDVDGVLTADNRIVPEAATIPELSPDEAETFATFGAKVLHPQSVRPALALGISVRVCNSRTRSPGTIINRSIATPNSSQFLGVTGLKNLSMIRVTAHDSASQAVVSRLHDVLIQHDVTPLLMTKQEDRGVALVHTEPNLFEVVERLAPLGRVETVPHCGVVTLMRRGGRFGPDVLKRVNANLSADRLELMAQVGNNVGLAVVLPQDRLDDAIRALHRDFFQRPTNGETP